MQYKVKSSQIEGQHPLVNVTPVVLLKIRILFAVILTICSFTIFAWALIWSNKLYCQFFFQVCGQHEATHYLVQTSDGELAVCSKRTLSKTYFTFRLLKYCFDEASQQFQPMEFESEGKSTENIINERNSITKVDKLEYFGNCQLNIPVEPIYVFFFKQLTGPFNFLQYFSVGVWLAQGTILYPIILLIFTIVALFVNYFLYRRSRYLLQKLANIQQVVTVKNDSEQQDLDGMNLLPGDIIILREGQQMNCDCAIIQGDVMVNEATLTGESVPVPKGTPQDMKALFEWEKLQQNVLFEGTKVVKTNAVVSSLAIVLRTGFTSLRGQYFRNVLFPAPPSKRFYFYAAFFIIELAVIFEIVQFILLGRWLDLNYSKRLITLRFLDAIVWSIPPSLPIFFSICKTVSLIRLSIKGINGSNADKVESAGRIDTCCFDKTGTLTTLGLKAQGHFTEDSTQEPMANIIMACCHHLVKINDEITGDPLEVEMFNHVKWQIEFENKNNFEVTDGQQTFNIEKIFEFSSARQMMSVIASNGSKYYLLTKGSPEVISTLAKNKSTKLESEMQLMAVKGFRILGLAYKEIQKEQITQQREQLESGLTFVGLFILENALKPDTADVISILKKAQLDIKVISGDNPFTTIHCAKSAGIVEQDKNVQLLDINTQTNSLIITGDQVNTYSLEDGESAQQAVLNAIQSESNMAITGKVLAYFSNVSEDGPSKQANSVSKSNIVYTENDQLKVNNGVFSGILLMIIGKATVFARQKPEQKKQIVELLQKLGRQVMMVGDGANDCSAIAQAQIGISFSEADASYTAPFSSKSTSIMCVVQVLQQGKAAIMTIIEVFQYQLSVNVMKFVCVAIMGLQGQSFSDFQFVYIGYMSSLPFLLFLTWSAPANELSEFIPMDNQFAIRNQLSMYNQMLTSTLGLVINSVIARASNPELFDVELGGEERTAYIREGLLNSVLFLGCLFYFMTMGISIYVSAPFKVKLYQNYPLLAWTLICSIIALVSVIQGKAKWLNVQEINEFTFKGFNWIVLAVMAGTSLVGFLNQIILRKYFPSQVRVECKTTIQ